LCRGADIRVVGGYVHPWDRLRAIDLSEERRLAGTVAGLLWISAAVTILILLMLPGIPDQHWRAVVVIASFASAWGVLCLTVIPWATVHPAVSHLSTFLGFPATAAGVAVTGGASSPAHLYLFFTIGYCGYFYKLREAVPHFLLCIVVTAMPLVYDAHAIADGFLAEVLILAACYLMLGGFISVGKARLVELREQARELSLADPLTGLGNRRALLERLERSVATGSGTTALLLVDLDYFKDVNTLYGHPVGDSVLCATADGLRSAARPGDLVARLGGDEFALVLDRVDQRDTLNVAHRVLHEVREAVLALELPRLRVTASVGYAISAEHGDVAALMAAADIALRGSKGAGKNRASSPLDGAPA
jgi:diguanylate cyclase (GGDEF)-like protein